MSDTMLEISMEISKTIAAPREKLFNAWLDPEMLMKFMTPGPNMTVPQASADPVVGGRFDVVMRAGDRDLPHSGTYRVIDPHNRIAFATLVVFIVRQEFSRLTDVFTVDRMLLTSLNQHRNGFLGFVAHHFSFDAARAIRRF